MPTNYKRVSHLLFDEDVSFPAYPLGYPSFTYADTTDEQGHSWRLWGHEHSIAEISGGRLRIDEYQTQGAFSNAVLQFQGDGTGFAAEADFAFEFLHNDMGHNIYDSIDPANLCSASTDPFAPTIPGEWRLASFFNGSTGRGLTFYIATVGRPSGSSNVTTAGVYAHPANTDYVVRVERNSGVLTILVDGVVVATQTQDLGYSQPLAALGPTLGGNNTGNYYIPNNYATGEYADFSFYRQQEELEYPATLPMPQHAEFQSTERRRLFDPYEASARQSEQHGIQQIVFPPMNATQAAIFDEWWTINLAYGGNWFSAKWPLPEGLVYAVRRFLEAPKWEYLGRGYWRISAAMEVRGRGEMPLRVI